VVMGVIPRFKEVAMRMSPLLFPLALCLAFSASAAAAVTTSSVEYRQGDAVCEGYLAYDDALPIQLPGVLVVHDWMGIAPFTRGVCERLAQMGYVAFAADIYGKGVRPADAAEAAKTAGIYRADPALMRARALAGLAALLASGRADPARIAVIGYCFGGGVALELARSGAPVAGTVVFHGALATASPAKPGDIKGPVLVLHGADDPNVPAEQVAAFEKEMRDAKVDWQLVKYGNAVHAFTLPAAGNDNSKGAAYNANADRRSWQAMKAFFAEVLAK
jgi:dienelactone hydrolase